MGPEIRNPGLEIPRWDLGPGTWNPISGTWNTGPQYHQVGPTMQDPLH